MVRRLGLGKNNHLTYTSLALNPQYRKMTNWLFDKMFHYKIVLDMRLFKGEHQKCCIQTKIEFDQPGNLVDPIYPGYFFPVILEVSFL